MTTRTYETILVDVDEGVATVTFNRPEKMNAFNHQMTVEFPGAMWALDADDSVRAIVVTGAGRAYCAGIDLEPAGDAFGSAAHGKSAEDSELGVTAESITNDNAFWRMRTPVIAAINGAAIGAGLTTALLFDIRFAAEDARLAFPFTRLGIIAEANSTWLLPRLVGVERALDLLLTGRPFTGREAADMGVVTRALPRDQVLPAAQELARVIASNTAPASIALVKQLVYRNLTVTDRTASFNHETRLTWWVGDLPDAAEGVLAFLEKRPPAWTVSKHVEPPSDLRMDDLP
jgi:enoyl-CoA hydratase/carnithine racemase